MEESVEMINIKVLSRTDELKRLNMANGFSVEISEFLRASPKTRKIFLAIKENLVVGFAVVSDWEALPSSKELEIIEVAKPFRGKGIGSLLMHNIIEDKTNALIITLAHSPEPSSQERLVKFYGKFGFEIIWEMSDREVFMARIPRCVDYLNFCKKYIEEKLEKFSYEDFHVTKVMRMWGRAYAPWLKMDVFVLRQLLERIHSHIRNHS